MTFGLQMIDYPATDDAVDEAEDYGRFLFTVSYDVQVIGHYDVSKDQKMTRCSRFIKRRAGDRFH